MRWWWIIRTCSTTYPKSPGTCSLKTTGFRHHLQETLTEMYQEGILLTQEPLLAQVMGALDLEQVLTLNLTSPTS